MNKKEKNSKSGVIRRHGFFRERGKEERNESGRKNQKE